jgi:hypothetical protein
VVAAEAEFPTVCDYLDMAPTLGGTGDAAADAAFDLRFVHYVTGGGAHSPNPYWDIVEPAVSEHEGRRVVNGGRPDGSARLAYAQMLLQAGYAYAIPAPETLHWVAEFCAGRRIVELGAGRGYWAAQLARSGMSVEAYDVAPPDKVENPTFPGSSTPRTRGSCRGGTWRTWLRAGSAVSARPTCWRSRFRYPGTGLP